MERSLIASGIGGQGIQLSAQVLARAAIHEDRNVMMFGSYGGMMRGGNTEASLVLADGPVDSPPVLSRAWLGIVMHHEYASSTIDKLDDRSVLFVNSSVVESSFDTAALTVEVPATDLATDAATLVCATMVMVAAVAAATGLTGLDALRNGLDDALPPYRRGQLETNEAALSAGHAAGLELASQHRVPAAWTN